MIDLYQECPSFGRRWEKLSLKLKVIDIVIITWVPLFLLSIFEGKAFGHTPKPFFYDLAMTFRFLVSLPLMLQIPKYTGKVLTILLNQFVIAGVVQGEEATKFNALVEKAEHLKRSRSASTVIWICVYALVTYLFLFYDTMRFESWRAHDGEYTLAGCWLSFISHPIYFFVFFSFLWRSGVWWWLVYNISRLNLNIRPAHGDNTGGIGFMAGSVRAFSFPALTFSISFAAGATNLVIYENVSMDNLKFMITGLGIILTFLFVGPLFFFHVPLINAKKAWALKYNLLSSTQIDDFEGKWLKNVREEKKVTEEGILVADTFSALCDLNSTTERVASMDTVPFHIKDFYLFVLAIVVPFLPVIAMQVSWKVLFKQIMSLLHL